MTCKKNRFKIKRQYNTHDDIVCFYHVIILPCAGRPEDAMVIVAKEGNLTIFEGCRKKS